jgi:hypothetical protein
MLGVTFRENLLPRQAFIAIKNPAEAGFFEFVID